MAGRHARRGKGHRVETPDLELMPMLNVFISIIPMLLLSAAFVQLAVIPTGLPANAAAVTPPPEAADDAPPPPVTIWIRSSDYIVEGQGLARRSFARTPGGEGSKDPGRLQLEAALRALGSREGRKPEVRIVPETRTRYEEIIDIMDLARAAGMPNAALADAVPGAV
ncbi:MAG: biopolymer transporter ExbD [Candidatus Eisenbacteria bacterium]|nr:biopolymer transporter ExbD [Candidatus Eisenbacteria bacterium]